MAEMGPGAGRPRVELSRSDVPARGIAIPGAEGFVDIGDTGLRAGSTREVRWRDR